MYSYSAAQVQFAKTIPLDHEESRNGQKAAFLMACIGITSGRQVLLSTAALDLYLGLGRLLFGWVADLPVFKRNGNRILLQQV